MVAARVRLLGCGALAAASVVVVLGWSVGAIEEHLAFRLLGSFAGILPGTLRQPQGTLAAPLQGWRHHSGPWILVGVSIVVVPLPWLYHDSDGAYGIRNRWAMNSLTCLCITPICILVTLIRHPPSSYVRDAVRSVFGLWLIGVVWTVEPAIQKLGHSNLVHDPRVRRIGGLACDVLLAFGCHFEGLVVFVWVASLMARRLRVLEEDAGALAARHFGVLQCCMGAAFQALMWVASLYSPSSRSQARIYLYVGLALIFQAIWVVYTAVLARCLLRSIRLLRGELRRVSGAPGAEAAWALKVLRIELAACALLGVTSPLTWSIIALDLVQRERGLPDGALLSAVARVHSADLVVNTVSVAFLSGLLWQPGQPRTVKGPSWQSGAFGDTRPQSKVRAAVQDSIEWRATVETLAGRGFRLGDLLAFWQALLSGRAETMPGFDPHRSTTNDVVRQAVIPLSRDPGPTAGGRALASVWSGGQPLLPQRMVTHTWSGLFLHLVAAVVADGLEADSYGGVAETLLTAEGVEQVCQALEGAGTLSAVYWVCAFSVNQHASICGGFGVPPAPGTADREEWEQKRHDTVTGEAFRACHCCERKVFNDEPALCELNKFDEMMHFLSTNVAGFSHLIVVDPNFEVFRRAWCVAEIVESDLTHTPQHIKILSEDLLDLHYASLSALDVRECRASRAEDKDMILSSISDIEGFNSHLQWAIFGTEGLFSRWIDGQERVARIRRILRRARSAAARVPPQRCGTAGAPLVVSDGSDAEQPSLGSPASSTSDSDVEAPGPLCSQVRFPMGPVTALLEHFGWPLAALIHTQGGGDGHLKAGHSLRPICVRS